MRRSYRHSGSGRGSLSCCSTQSSIEALRLWQACAGWIYCCPGAHSSSSLAGGEPVSGRCNPHPPLLRASRSPPVVPLPPPPTSLCWWCSLPSLSSRSLLGFRPSASPGPPSQRALDLDPTHHPFLCGFVVLSMHTHIVHVTRSRAARRFPAAHGNGASDGESVRWKPANCKAARGRATGHSAAARRLL